MPKYNVCLAVNVSAYANVEVEAETEEQAIKLAREAAKDEPFSVEWDTSHSGDDDNEDYRIADIEKYDE